MEAFKGRSGSVIVGAMVVIVFMSLVTASMLKNTRSQSSASRSYAAVQAAQITVRSGIVATEAFFSRAENAEKTLEMLNDVLARGGSGGSGARMPYIYGSDAGRVRIADGQYFSSRLVSFDRDKCVARVEVAGGRSEKGRSLKRTDAFLAMGNIKINDAAAYGARNAIYMKGDLRNGDNGMEVNGNATFEGYAKFQNQPGIFRGEAFFNKDVDIMHGSSKFYGKTYVGGDANLQNIPSGGRLIFENDVGFNGNLATQSTSPLQVSGNVYLNGNFRHSGGVDNNMRLQGAGANDLHYTGNLSLALSGSQCAVDPGNPARCLTHNANMGGHPGDSRVTGFSNKILEPGRMDITGVMGMGGIEERRDPQIDIGKIDSGIMRPAFSALGVNFTVAALDRAYEDAAQKGELYNGHLVVKFRRGDPNVNFSNGNPGVFNKKVIFIVEDGATAYVNMNFYHSGPESSTLVYVGPGNASLNQFGSSGPFRGLIYIDSLNTSSQNSFNFRAGGSIEGAVHNFSSRDFMWNGGGRAVPITFNAGVLDAFAPLVKDAASGGGDGTVTLADTADRRIRVRAVGYYYY